MGELQYLDVDPTSAPARVSFATWRRLSSRLRAEPTGRWEASRRAPAWLSLQGRLVGAEEATSARAVKGGLSREEVAAWELFSPMERVLVVAVVAAAAKDSKAGKKIAQLQRSVEIRDEVLLNMQKKLEDLCEQVDYAPKEVIAEKRDNEFCICGHAIPKSGSGMENNKSVMFPMGQVCGNEEPEERRMSDISDFSSVTSSVDIQLSALAQEQDFYNLRKECEEKDAAIKDLTAAAHESSIAGSKRILELEEVIRRKNMVITKLKKDMLFLEQKVIQLTRLRRPSTALTVETTKLPTMATNLLYDMSSTSPSSSDADSPVKRRAHQSPAVVKSDSQTSIKSLSCSNTLPSKSQKQRSANSDKEYFTIHRGSLIETQRSANSDKENFTIHRGSLTETSRTKRLVSSGGEPKRRRTQQETNVSARQKRWA